MYKFIVIYNITGRYFTLIMVDPDIVSPSSLGTQSHPLVHWMVTNINRGDLSTGRTVHSYRGPQPPSVQTHTYYFLLYEQDGLLDIQNTNSYDGNCEQGQRGRSVF